MKPEARIFDLIVIGGGINGAGIAANAASRGLQVALCEKADLAQATSSASTKLIHGGLRYLETYEFALVRKALKESEVLLKLAPHLIHPIDIDIPYMAHHRPWLMIRAGLFLYNHLAKRPGYPLARSIKFDNNSPLVPELTHGFRFSDGQVDDARLVIVNALQATSDNAEIFTRCECIGLQVKNDLWQVSLRNQLNQKTGTLKARALVNASGPWVSSLVSNVGNIKPRFQVRLVKGSHLVVPRIEGADNAYLLQNEDGRVVFVIPYLDHYSLIGTTEEDFSGDAADAEISDEEIEYLLVMLKKYFKAPVMRDQIIASYAGVRALMDDETDSATRASRDYKLELEDAPLPFLSVYGGKVTTYRILAEDAVDRLAFNFPDMTPSFTRTTILPGGDFEKLPDLKRQLVAACPGLPDKVASRWCQSYGTLSMRLLGNTTDITQLGIDFGHGLFQCEVDYLIEHEWARTADDILWRLVSTERMDGFDAEVLNTMTLTEADGRTTLTLLMHFDSQEARDGAAATGMADGIGQSFDRLETAMSDWQTS